MAKSEYAKFEKSLDSSIEKLNFSRYPLRSMLTLFHLMIATMAEEREEKIHFFSSLFSYLLPLLNECNKNEIGSNALNAFSVIPDTFQEELKNIMNYGVFCEIAPYIWKDVYKPICTDENHLELIYNNGYYEFELKDAILTDLALNFTRVADMSKNIRMYRDQITLLLQGKADYSLLVHEILEGKAWYKTNHYDTHIVSEELYQKLNITKNDFVEFQTFWFALSDYYIKSYKAILLHINKTNDTSNLIQNEMLEHMSPLLKLESLIKMLPQKISGISEEKFKILMDIFSIDIRNTFDSFDGYFPTFFKFDNAYMFSPYNIRTKISSRNLLFLLNKKNKKLFDEEISCLLEPNLINHTVHFLRHIPNTRIEINKQWSNGEFDIIMYHAEKNLIFHIQAKGAIPVEGARMTRNLEDRIEEGIKQILALKELPIERQNSIFKDIFRHDINQPTIIDIVLGWAGFGTAKIWSKMNTHNIIPLNLGILKTYITYFEEKSFDISNFKADINEIIDEIIKSTNPQKTTIHYQIMEKNIEYESFNYEHGKLLKYKYI